MPHVYFASYEQVAKAIASLVIVLRDPSRNQKPRLNYYWGVRAYFAPIGGQLHLGWQLEPLALNRRQWSRSKMDEDLACLTLVVPPLVKAVGNSAVVPTLVELARQHSGAQSSGVDSEQHGRAGLQK